MLRIFSSMSDLAVILPYAVSIRDFVHTGTLEQLLEIPGVRMQIYTQYPALPEFDAIRSDRVSILEMPESGGSRIERLLKTLYPLLFHDTFYYVRQSLAASPAKRTLAQMLNQIWSSPHVRRSTRWTTACLSKPPVADYHN